MLWLAYEVDTGPATEDVGTWHNSPPSPQPLGRSRVVERSCLRVELHVFGVYAGPEWISHSTYVECLKNGTWEPMDC